MVLDGDVEARWRILSLSHGARRVSVWCGVHRRREDRVRLRLGFPVPVLPAVFCDAGRLSSPRLRERSPGTGARCAIKNPLLVGEGVVISISLGTPLQSSRLRPLRFVRMVNRSSDVDTCAGPIMASKFGARARDACHAGRTGFHGAPGM